MATCTGSFRAGNGEASASASVDAEDVLAALAPELVHETDELYLLSPASDASVKVRDQLMDVKQLEHVNADGLEQWRPVMKAEFPLGSDDVRFVLDALHEAAVPVDRSTYAPDDVARLTLTVPVHKRRTHYRIDGCLAELSELEIDGRVTARSPSRARTPRLVIATVRRLGLDDRRNVSVARGIKTLLGVGAQRYAVIDIGTNSVKLHVAERSADGEWHALADRAVVTRLGEGLARLRAARRRADRAHDGGGGDARRRGARTGRAASSWRSEPRACGSPRTPRS